MINRNLADQIKKRLFKGKAIILIGARQVGKTTLINEILKELPEKKLIINGDEADSFIWAKQPTTIKLKALIGEHKIIFFDEAHHILNIGIIAKLIIDTIPDVQVIIFGSSSLEIKNLLYEPN